MSLFKTTWWRPASALIVLALAVAALSVGGRGTALAVVTDGSVTATPNPLQIGVGGSGQFSVDMTPAAAGTSIWIIQIAYDPAVAQVAMSGGNPVCTGLNTSVALPGSAGAASCDIKDTNSDSVPDTLVIFGGVILNNGGTAVGLTTPQTLATFTFNAAAGAAVGAHTALTTTVTSFLGPNGQTPTPATSDGAIDIVASTGTSRIWGNSDCSVDGVTSRDSQAVLKNVLQKTPLSQDPGCPAVGASVTVAGVTLTWGNWDCSTDGITSRDSQAVLKNVLQKTPLSQDPGCPLVGDTVIVS